MAVVVVTRPAEPASSALRRRKGQAAVLSSARVISALRADVGRLPIGEPDDTGAVADDEHAAGTSATRKATVRIKIDTVGGYLQMDCSGYRPASAGQQTAMPSRT
jgi:hypothetical protein